MVSQLFEKWYKEKLNQICWKANLPNKKYSILALTSIFYLMQMLKDKRFIQLIETSSIFTKSQVQ